MFCGNGKHENPDIRVVRRLINSRIGSSAARNPNPQLDNAFKLWFTSDGTTFKANESHMEKIRQLVDERIRESNRKSVGPFLTQGSLRHHPLTAAGVASRVQLDPPIVSPASTARRRIYVVARWGGRADGFFAVEAVVSRQRSFDIYRMASQEGHGWSAALQPF